MIGLGICFVGVMLLVANPAEVTGANPENQAGVTLSGELQQWHKVTLTIDGPEASEGGTPNPFLDYRMQVTFHHSATGLTYNVPGYFAADGDAANTSATAGNKWRVHLAPDHAGEWTYDVSFRQGPSVAISDAPDAGTPVDSVDGLKGTFSIAASDKTGRDFRAKGRLNYVGKHHLQFAGTGEFFLKAGADAPENFLAYVDFDGDFKTDGQKDNLIKDWGPHVQDWKPGDPTWQTTRGKGMIGAINYLASQGLNSFSFLTLNIIGDDRNVFPYTTYDERERIDCSRMDQWETVFAHGTNLGMYLHFKTQEAENVNLLDDGQMGPQRKLYYRELIARFAHHLALNWNLGEEVGLGHEVSTKKKKDWAKYLWTHDPYQHHIVIHNGNNHFDLLGVESELTGFSLQTNRPDFSNVHGSTLNYLRRSVEAGKPWVVACDEPGDAQHSLITDAEDPTHDNARKNALWGNLMAGGAGVEWYFGYKHPHSDLTCQDYRVREKMWEQCRIALAFFANQKIPFWNMTNADNLLGSKNAYCLCDPGKLYLVYRKQAEQTTLDLSAATGLFEVLWFNPRTGGALQQGSTQVVSAGGKAMIGDPPNDSDQDWLAVVRPGDPKRDYPPGVSAGPDVTIMLPRSGNTVTVALAGKVSDDGKPGSALTSKWTKSRGPGNADFEDATSQNTKVTLSGAGEYRLTLTASDGKQNAESSLNVIVEPFEAKVTRTLYAMDDAFLEGTSAFSNQYLKVEGKRRTTLIKFDVQGLPPNILDARLRLTGSSDGGGGTLRVFRGSHSDWTGSALTKASAPTASELIAKQSVNVGPGDVISIPVLPMINGDGTYTFVVTLDEGGDDIWFVATGSGAGPELQITFEDADGRYDAFGQPAEEDASVLSAVTDFEYTYDQAQAKKVHKQNGGIVVVEAEAFDAADHNDHRKWYLTTADETPNIKPDPDPNHAETASGGAYLEILPDTRVTHGDPLVNGVSFSNVPGQCSVLYYPVIIDTPGRYYVWVRMCCTGSEDNGLHVGIDGVWPESGARLQFTGQHGQWQWDSRQRTESAHSGVLGQIWLDIDEPGLHTIMFSMREDGFEFDKFMLTQEQKPMESKSLDSGPQASPTRSLER
ncbi:DUF5060 domain-containing protein [Novipirellula artificiosorum]|uniref:DUF5060 domain-containing protein n=1 Tax=Novipirellula artificiosorum TaxID=2528016 RepID=A0A5C6DLU5_9BACT|nr:DUF5060 domain-containing protein [Novipirellula artificiosorum]TWU37114.1 hypothetical protein Poly41_32410 [Novipirellula artificiosorum]